MKRQKLMVAGQVQGVGFRPFVYRLAAELELTGHVINDSRGVVIEVQGGCGAVDRFAERLAAENKILLVHDIVDLKDTYLSYHERTATMEVSAQDLAEKAARFADGLETLILDYLASAGSAQR